MSEADVSGMLVEVELRGASNKFPEFLFTGI